MKKSILFFSLLIGLLVSGCGEANDYTVISYNIRHSGDPEGDGVNQWMNRRQATEKMIRTEAPDFFGIQEGLIDQVHFIEEACPEYGRIGIGRDDGVEEGEIMAIFYLKDKFELLDNGTFWLSETPDTVSRGWDAACNRTATWVKLKERATGREFYYFNTHLDHRGRTARKESVLLLESRIKSICAGEKLPVLLTGDFNAVITEPFMKPLLDSMKDARLSAPVSDSRTTYHDWGEVRNSVIDHIFGTGVVFDTFTTLDGNYGAPYISDHYPIKATFRFE